MVNVPGFLDDAANIPAFVVVNSAGMNTWVKGNGMIASGGVDSFLARAERVVDASAPIGRHSWLNGSEDGASLPKSDTWHLWYSHYYRDISLSKSIKFYWFMQHASPASGAHHMTDAEIIPWDISTSIARMVSSSSQVAEIGLKKKVAGHQVTVGRTSTLYIEDDESDSTFYPRSGVTHRDGGLARADSITFKSGATEYTITIADNEHTLKNVETLLFAGDGK